MSTATVAVAPPARRRAAQLAMLVLAAVTIITLVLVVTASRRIGRTTHGFSDATFVMTGIASGHREVLRMEIAAAADDPPTAEIQLHADLLANQLRLLTSRLAPDTDGRRRVDELRAQLAELHDLLLSTPADASQVDTRAELRDQLHALELNTKELYDSQEGRFFDATATALDVTRSSQRLLGLLALGTGVLGAGMVIWLQRLAKQDLRGAFASLVTEMGERQAAEAHVRLSEERFRSLVQHSSDMVAVLEPSGAIQYWSPSRSQLLGDVADGELRDRSYLEFVHPDDRSALQHVLEASDQNSSHVVEYRLHHTDGSWRTVESFLSNQISSPAVSGIVVNTRDVTERKRFEDELTRQAFHDGLTGLANRALFADRLTHASERLGRAGAAIAVLMIDLDGFKTLNDTLGHAAGDAVLKGTADRLGALVRSADTVGRLGGDEFAILLEDASLAEAEDIAQRVVEALGVPFILNDTELRVTASVGVSASDQPTANADTLLREADMAMYFAKREGKANYRRFETSMGMHLLDRIELEGDLRVALQHDEMEVFYQPTVDLSSGAMVGVEALVRWNHPLRGQMAPLSFIPVAEESGLIVPLGMLVLRQACVEMFDLPPAHGRALWLAVNISPRQLREPGFGASVTAILAETGFPADRLVLEITESTLIEEMATCVRVLHDLRVLGIKIAVDDFGTGYSSLGYLKQLPIDVLKIDRSFTAGLLSGAEDAAVAHAIVKLGSTMHFEVVAEGVEEAGQADELRALACPLAQGFFFARPMPMAALRQYVDTSGADTEAAPTLIPAVAVAR